MTPAVATAQEYSEPADNYLHEVVQEWSQKSKIGCLRDATLGDGEMELRIWSGIGLTGTVADFLSGRDGTWGVSSIYVESFFVGATNEIAAKEDLLPPCVLNEMSKRCILETMLDMNGDPLEYQLDCAMVSYSGREKNQEQLAALWDRLVKLDLLELPPSVERDPYVVVADGLGYVIEVRVGDSYRATVIRHDNEHPVDKQVHKILKAYDAVVGTEIYPYEYDRDK